MKNGFTMIELIFVIVVLGILAAVAIPKFNGIQTDAQISYEKNTIGALRSTIDAIHAKSIIRNGDFTAYTDSPNGTGQVAIYIKTSKNNYPTSLSIENTPQADGKYHLTDQAQIEDVNGLNGHVLAVIMTYNSRDKFSTGKTFIADGTEGICDVNSNNCKQLIEGPVTKKSGVSPNEGIYEYYKTGAWVYNSVEGIITYVNQKSDGTDLNILDNSSPDF